MIFIIIMIKDLTSSSLNEERFVFPLILKMCSIIAEKVYEWEYKASDQIVFTVRKQR